MPIVSVKVIDRRGDRTTKQQVRAKLENVGTVPVVRASSATLSRMAVDAVCLGGIPIAEITMTFPDGASFIHELVREMGDEVLVGAGTVLDIETA